MVVGFGTPFVAVGGGYWVEKMVMLGSVIESWIWLEGSWNGFG